MPRQGKNRIKGITVELEADVSGVTRSFKDLDQSLKDTQSYLKDVNKLLKLDPGNTELLKQKQEYLNKSIQDTETRLKGLKDAYKKLDGDESDKAKEDQKALAREIADTEQSLKLLKEQMRDFGSVAKQQLEAVGQKFKDFGEKLTNVGSKLTTRVTAPIAAGFTLAVDAASDYEENINKLEVAFGDYADEVRAFTDNAQMDFGLSMKDASESASAFGALAKGIGLSEEASADMAVELTKLSADLGSYFNTDIETAAGALEGIFTGNAQSLKKFGVVMTDVNLKEFAEELGMTAKEYNNLGSEDKAMLRFQYVMAQTADAQGDFARTNDGTANSMKSMQAAVEDLTVAIGEQLIPIVVPIIQKITGFITKLSKLDKNTLKIATTVAIVAAALGPLAMVLGTISNLVGGLISGIGFFTTPIGTAVFAIGGLIAVGTLFIQNLDKIKAAAGAVAQKVKSDFQQIKDFVANMINAMVDKFNSFKSAIANALDLSSIASRLKGFFGQFASMGASYSGGGGSRDPGSLFGSGGMMSSITLNNTFTINNGANIDRSTVLSWADVLTERINENLGRMV